MGNKFGHCVLHRVDDGIDSGEIVALEEFLYPANFRKPIDFERHYIEKTLILLLTSSKSIVSEMSYQCQLGRRSIFLLTGHD